MTVSSTTVKKSYNGNGSTTAFTYDFLINTTAELKVIIRSSTGTETVKTISSHYNISDSSGSGTVTFTSGNIPASGETVILIRDTNLTQGTDYVENDPFPSSSHESALDKLTLQVQEVQEELDRAIKLSRTNTMTSTEFTVGATDRASKILAFDSSGEISVTQELGTVKGNWGASTTYAIRDIVKDTSTNNIFIALTAHTSSGSQPLTSNTDSAKWSLLVDAASATSSATNAASSATAAANSATAAASSATIASGHKDTATTKASEASNSASAAATSATAAATSLDNFDDRYLGQKSSDPSTDNDGASLLTGALYFNTSNNVMMVYSGSAWQRTTPTSSEQTNINNLAASAVITDMALLATSDVISDMNTLATSDIISDLNTLATSDIVSDLNTLATSSNVTNMATLGASGVVSNIATVAGISSAVSAVNSNSSNINSVNSNSSNINTVAGNSTNINTVAGISSNVTTVAGVASDIAASPTNATNAANSATAAATSATNASNSASAAATSAASAASAYDTFDDRYLGSKSSNPSADNDGNSLVTGALYFNSSANEMRVFDGGNWIAASSAGTASMILYEYTASSNQTSFSGSDNNSATLSYSVDNLQVVLNGIVLDPGDFTATNGTAVVLAAGAAANDLLNVYAFKSFTVSELNANNLNDGTIPDARFPATLPAISGANLTNLDAADLASGTVPTARLGSGTASSSTFLAGDQTFKTITVPAGTTINNNANNRLITGSGTANTLEGEASLTFDGTNLDLPDDKKIRLGTGNDLEIYHDGSNSYIKENGTGDLIIRAESNIKFQDSSGSETFANFKHNDSVELFTNGTKVFQTVSDGVEILGHVKPSASNTYDLGTSSVVWRNIYTSDFHMTNEGLEEGNSVDGTKGSWTFQEGAEDLFLLNNKNGKKYKFKLEECK